jgi:hypothetical protein
MNILSLRGKAANVPVSVFFATRRRRVRSISGHPQLVWPTTVSLPAEAVQLSPRTNLAKRV